MILPNPPGSSPSGGAPNGSSARRDALPADARRQMIDETSAFLTWALAKERGLPRIPRRAVGGGGFGGGFGRLVMSRPLARTVALHFWGRAFDLLGRGR